MKTLLKIQHGCLIILMMALMACEAAMNPEPIKKGTTPDPVSQYTSESIPGGAIITYQVPGGGDLRYVKATYTLNTGVVREAKSTLYKNTLTVDGFSKAGEYEIKLFSVGVGEIESTPTMVKIKALVPANQLIIDSLKVNNHMYATFGGVNFDYQNATESSMVIRVMTKNLQNNWEVVGTTYTQAKNGRIRLRGYDPVDREFAVFVTDRWNNKSDTLIRSLKPIFEVMFDKKLFKQFNLPGDTYTPHTGAPTAKAMPVLWDGLWNRAGSIWHTRPSDVMPQHFTWDMGVKAKLSRFIFYPNVDASNSTVFGVGQPSSWELWGSNDPNPDGTFASWTLVGTFNSVKPSGLPIGQKTNEDIELCLNGEEFEVDQSAKSYRYWRWRQLSNWGNVNYCYMSEFSFFGIAE